MALVIADRVQETTTTTGTGTITLAGASTQFQSFSSGIGAGNSTYYCLLSGDGINWETGLGTVGGAGPFTLARTTIFSSSNSGAAISLSGMSVVFCDVPATQAGLHALFVSQTNTTTSFPATTEIFLGFNTVVTDTDGISGSAVNLSAAVAGTSAQGITVPASWNGRYASISGSIKLVSDAGNGTIWVGVYRSSITVAVAESTSTAGYSNPARNATLAPFQLQTGDIIFVAMYHGTASALSNFGVAGASNWLGVYLLH